MEIYHLTYPEKTSIDDKGPFSMALGFFDGLHTGHQTVIGEAVRKAKELGIRSAVMTFDPHPSHLFERGKNKVGYITQYDEKTRLLEEMGVDALFIVKFDWDLASLSPEQFIELFIKGLGVKHVTAGFDFTFGSKGSGTMEQMDSLAGGAYGTTTVEKVKDNDEKISSTRIRKLLAKGDVEKTAALLGRPFRTSGIVVHGEKRGRQLGFPTANISYNEDSIIPSIGVYAVRIEFAGNVYGGVCSVGKKPTFHDSGSMATTVEVHIIDFDDDIYGVEVKVDWITYIRGEVKFSSIDALIQQIGEDKEMARRILSKD